MKFQLLKKKLDQKYFDNMGDPQRFKQFAQLIIQKFPGQNTISDIAAGCGELSY